MHIFVRRLLLVTLVIGLVGIQAELILLEHYGDWWQFAPLILNGVALLLLIAHAVRPSAGAVRGVRLLMFFFVASGIVGTWLHYDGNAGFELEITPDMAQWSVFKAAISGATPVLAPGSMIQLGLVGLAWCFRHPALAPKTSTSTTSSESDT